MQQVIEGQPRNASENPAAPITTTNRKSPEEQTLFMNSNHPRSIKKQLQ